MTIVEALSMKPLANNFYNFPFVPGDKFYWLSELYGDIYEEEVFRIIIEEEVTYFETDNGDEWTLTEILDDLGDIIFRTREEAEKEVRDRGFIE